MIFKTRESKRNGQNRDDLRFFQNLQKKRYIISKYKETHMFCLYFRIQVFVSLASATILRILYISRTVRAFILSD